MQRTGLAMEHDSTYPSILQPLTIGKVTVRHRIMVTGHTQLYGRDELLSDRHIDYYAERARGGAALLVLEQQAAHPAGRNYHAGCRAWDPAVVPWYEKLGEAVHAHDCRQFVQLFCAGAQGRGTQYFHDWRPLWAASRIPSAITEEMPVAMTATDIAELADSAFREGEFRYTPWSEMSNPAVVQDETEMFLARADDRRGVDLDVYQWMSETGTYVKGPFKKLQRGDRVAAIGTEDSRGNMIGQLETDVLRPVNMTFATEKIDYVTSNTLVDFQHIAAMSPEDHPDLDLGGRRLKIARDEALTMNQFGELVALDTSSQDARYKAIEARQQQQEQLWSHLKNAAGPAGAAGGIDGLLEGYGAGEGGGFPSGYGSGGEYPGADYGSGGEYPGGGGESGGGSSRRRRRSSLKRGGMGMGGYGSGGGYPGGEF